MTTIIVDGEPPGDDLIAALRITAATPPAGGMVVERLTGRPALRSGHAA